MPVAELRSLGSVSIVPFQSLRDVLNVHFVHLLQPESDEERVEVPSLL